MCLLMFLFFHIAFLYSLIGVPLNNNGTSNSNATNSTNVTDPVNGPNGTNITNGNETTTEPETDYATLASFYVAIIFIPGLLLLFVACRYVPDFFYKMCSEA